MLAHARRDKGPGAGEPAGVDPTDHSCLEHGEAASAVALMACCGARYHHDGDQYGGAVFCNLFLGEDKGLDLHFPAAGRRIPLARGTVVVFEPRIQSVATLRLNGGPDDVHPRRTRATAVQREQAFGKGGHTAVNFGLSISGREPSAAGSHRPAPAGRTCRRSQWFARRIG